MNRSHSRFRPRFRTGRRPVRSGLLGWWNLWRVPTLVTLVAAIWWFAVRPIADEQGWVPVDQPLSLCGAGERTDLCIVDGDTLRVSQRGARPRRIRLTGFDAPELDGACEAERKLARQARAALLEWLDQGPFEWNGADDPPFDQYGRELRKVRRKGRAGAPEYLAEAMVDAGLADATGWDEAQTDWCR